MSGGSSNHDFVVETAMRLGGGVGARVLDFGCGTGLAVALGRRRGLDIVGVDTFDGHYGSVSDGVDPGARPFVSTYRERLPFDDGAFDVVVSNMVFEHVPDLPAALAEIARVTRPGGALLALFPVAETWYEGHSGLYGIHWLRAWPRTQVAYASLMHRLGLGLYRAERTPRAWAQWMVGVLAESCVYHRRRAALDAIEAAVGSKPRSLAAEFVAFRLENHPRAAIMHLAKPLYSLVCRVRVGEVVVASKPA